VQFIKASIIFFVLSYTPFTHSTNLVSSVSEIPIKIFYHSVQTNKLGQYIEYNEKLLTLRQYDNKGIRRQLLWPVGVN